MLNYLDIYPLTLPARYTDRVACYTTVYITSNVPLSEQYMDIQRYQLETWRAFLRRVQNIIEYLPDGSTIQEDCRCDRKRKAPDAEKGRVQWFAAKAEWYTGFNN